MVGSSQGRAGRKLSRKSPSIAESHAPEIFADEFVMLSRKIQKPPAGTHPPSHPVTPAVPVSISVRWSIAILALSPPLALLSIPDRLSLWLVPFRRSPPPSLNPFLASSRVRVSLYHDFQYHARTWNEGGRSSRDRSLLWRVFLPTLHLRFNSEFLILRSWFCNRNSYHEKKRHTKYLIYRRKTV